MNIRLFTQAAFLTLLLMIVLQGCVVNTFTKGVTNPERTQGLRAPAPQGTHELITLKGPGTFLSAHVTKQGGGNGLTFVSLDIDGKNVVNTSMVGAKNWGLTQNSPYILNMVKPSGDIKTLTIGQSYPLYFARELKLSVSVREDGVVQILSNVIHGK
ncbi:MAG: hypothetical protein ABW092_06610 [Candidatus Thiodiazotropha sp.]